MAARPARALPADRRWAAVAAAPTTRGAPGTSAPKPTNLSSTHRVSFAWGNDKPAPPASKAWGSPSLLSLNNDEGSGSLANVNVRPASAGSSGSSTSGGDLLDSPLAWDQNPEPVSASSALTLHNSAIDTSRPQRTDSSSGSVQLSRSQTSFSEALKAPRRNISKLGTTSHGRGFTLTADDFPVLVSKISESKSQPGHSSQGRSTFGSGSMATQDEQQKNLIAGDDSVPNTDLPMEEQKAQSYNGTQAPNICMPPPCLDHWNPPPDHPPDRNRIWRRGAASYGPHKPGNAPDTGSFPVEALTQNGQTLLHEEGEARHGGPVHGRYHSESRDSCYAPVPTDACVKSLPHLIPGKVKDSHSVTLEKLPVIKKDLVLLEKIRLLNIKARMLRAQKTSEISSCRESKFEHPKSIDVKAEQVAKDIPFCAVTSDAGLANCVSECPSLVLNVPSNVSADCVVVGLSEAHVTESSEVRKLGKSADRPVQEEESMAKPEVNSNSYAHSHKSYNAPIEANKNLRRQKAGGNGTADHDTSTSDTCFIEYAKNLNVPPTANEVKNAAVSISPTPPSDTVGVTTGPLIHSVAPSANKTDLNLVEHIAQKSAEESNGTIVRKLLPMERRQRQIHSRDRILRERSNIAGSTEHTRNVAGTLMDTRRSEEKHRIGLSTKIENRRPLVPHALFTENAADRTSMHTRRAEDKPHVYLSTENENRKVLAPHVSFTENTDRTLMCTQRSDEKYHVDLSTKNENRRPVSPHLFYTENTEASSVHKNHTSGVVINSSIIPVQVSSVRGFTVGSIMLGDVSLTVNKDEKTVNQEEKTGEHNAWGCFTVGSIMLGDVSLTSMNQEEKTEAKKVHGTTNGCDSPQQTKQFGTDNQGVQLAKGADRNDSVMITAVKEPTKKKLSEIGKLNFTAIPAPAKSSGDHNIVKENVDPAKMSKMEKPACGEQHLQNFQQIAMVEGHTSCNNSSSTSKLEGEYHGEEALDTSTDTKNEVQTEAGNHKARVAEKKNRKRRGRSSASGNKVSTNGLAPEGPRHNGEGANSLFLNVMQELSHIPQKGESKTHVVTQYRPQPTGSVLLPDNNWKMHLGDENQRQYQGDPLNAYTNYIDTSATMHSFHNGTPHLMAHLVPQPFPSPQIDALVNGVPGWKWDLNEGILLADMENFAGLGSANVDRSSGELSQNVFSPGTVDLHGGQMVGDMVYQAVNPSIQYHTDQEHQQLSPAWHLIAQHDGMNHGGSGTGVYWPKMERNAGMLTQGANQIANPMGGLMQVEYQVVPPVASSGAAYGWSQDHSGSDLKVPLRVQMR